jgi:hypothetical protein
MPRAASRGALRGLFLRPTACKSQARPYRLLRQSCPAHTACESVRPAITVPAVYGDVACAMGEGGAA